MSKNIMDLWKENSQRPMLVKRDHWGNGNYAYVSNVTLNEINPQYGVAYGEIHYADGNEIKGKIPNAGCYGWLLIKVFE